MRRVIGVRRGRIPDNLGDPAPGARRHHQVVGHDVLDGDDVTDVDPAVFDAAMRDAMQSALATAFGDAVGAELRRRCGRLD